VDSDRRGGGGTFEVCCREHSTPNPRPGHGSRSPQAAPAVGPFHDPKEAEASSSCPEVPPPERGQELGCGDPPPAAGATPGGLCVLSAAGRAPYTCPGLLLVQASCQKGGRVRAEEHWGRHCSSHRASCLPHGAHPFPQSGTDLLSKRFLPYRSYDHGRIQRSHAVRDRFLNWSSHV